MLVEPEPPTLVALTNCGDPTMLVSAKVTEGLLSYDFDLNPQPQLAIGWSVSVDCREFTFRLRADVRWHDGRPFTSRDVAVSIRLLKDLHGRGRTTFANVSEVRTPDMLTAIIVLSQPAPYLLRAFAACESPIMPAHRYTEGDALEHQNGVAPVGTGPFIFKEWVAGSHITYERNNDYWDSPKPYVDRVIVRFIEDADVKVAAIEDGSIDLAPGTPVPLEWLRRLSANPRLRMVTNGYLYLNQIVRLEFNLDHPEFGKLAVRQAIAHSLRRQTIIDEAWLGYGKVAYGPISPDLKQFCLNDLETPAFSLAQAGQLLDAANLPKGRDGVRLRAILDYVPAGDGYRRTADCVVRALSAVGIEAQVREQDFSAYIKRIYSDRDFAFVVGRMNNMFDPTVGVQRVFWSKSFRKGVPFSNASHFANNEVDQLLERAATEPDVVKRLHFLHEFQRKIVEELPDITLLAPKQFTVSNIRLCDHTITADGAAGNLSSARVEA